MKLLIFYLTITLIGYMVGNKVLNKNKKYKWTGKVQTVALIILIFTMGARIGSDEQVVGSLTTIGFISFVLTAFAIFGSIVSIILARKLMGIDKRGLRTSVEAVKTVEMDSEAEND